MVQIAPSVLSADFSRLAEHCRQAIVPGNNILHFDVMDGVFVPNISIGVPVLKSLHAAMPNTYYDVHLMIIKPDKYIDDFCAAGASALTIHVESDCNVKETLCAIRSKGMRAGVSLRPKTPLESIFPLLPFVDSVLVMSVEPGFGGQSFMPNSPKRIAAVRSEAARQNTPLIIEVDGGINLQTAPLCVNAGADILVAGSAVFSSDNPAEIVQNLKCI